MMLDRERGGGRRGGRLDAGGRDSARGTGGRAAGPLAAIFRCVGRVSVIDGYSNCFAPEWQPDDKPDDSMASDCVIHRDLTSKVSRSIDGLRGCIRDPVTALYPPAPFQVRLYPHAV